MKITKTKKVETVTEEIEILDGTYYFSYGYKKETPYEFYKVIIDNKKFKNKDYTNLTLTKVRNSSQDYLVLNKEDFTNYLGVAVEWYFKGEWNQTDEEIKEISAEEFEQQKQEVIKKLNE